MKQVFIVGCPRSGATWTAYLLAQHPEIAGYQHSKLFGYLTHLQRWYRNRSRLSLIVHPRSNGGRGESYSLAKVFPEEDLYPLIREFAQGIGERVKSSRPGASVLVDKTPENAYHADFILKVIPDAYFLHVVRDPRNVYCSHREAARSWARREFPTQPVDGGRFWRESLEAAIAIGERTERYLQIRYEDLEERGTAELERILRWLELEIEPGFCERAVALSNKEEMRKVRSYPEGFVRKVPEGGWRTELSGRDARILEYMASDLMTKLGYELTQKPFRFKPMEVWARDVPAAILGALDRRLHWMTQRAHWRWVGRRLEWNDP